MVFDDADDRFETSFMRTRLVFKKARRRPNDRFASADREVVSSRYGGKQITICNKSQDSVKGGDRSMFLPPIFVSFSTQNGRKNHECFKNSNLASSLYFQAIQQKLRDFLSREDFYQSALTEVGDEKRHRIEIRSRFFAPSIYTDVDVGEVEKRKGRSFDLPSSKMAPRVGLEPTTCGLTVRRSTD